MQVDVLRMLDDAELRAIASRLEGADPTPEDRELRDAVDAELARRAASLPAPRPSVVEPTVPTDSTTTRTAALAAVAAMLALVLVGAVLAFAASGDSEPDAPATSGDSASPASGDPVEMTPPADVPVDEPVGGAMDAVAPEDASTAAIPPSSPASSATDQNSWQVELAAVDESELPVDPQELVDGFARAGVDLPPSTGLRIDTTWDAACVHTGFGVDCDRTAERPAALHRAIERSGARLRGRGVVVVLTDPEDPQPAGRVGSLRVHVTRWADERDAISVLEQLLLLEPDAKVVQLGTTGDGSATVRRALAPCTDACDVQELVRFGDRVVVASSRYRAMSDDLVSVDPWRRAAIGRGMQLRAPA